MSDLSHASAWLIQQVQGALSPYKPDPDHYADNEIPCCKNYVEAPRYVMFFHPQEKRIVFYAFEGPYGPFPPQRIEGLDSIPEKRRDNNWTEDVWYGDTFAKQEKLI